MLNAENKEDRAVMSQMLTPSFTKELKKIQENPEAKEEFLVQ